MSETAQNTIEGPGKGRAFFERARTVAETGNHDYAIDMYIEGLNREPQNIEEHQALFDVALRRKVKGGKPAGGLFGPKTPFKGKSPKEQMLNAEWLLAKDPGNLTHMLALLRQASAGEYADVIRWFGPLVVLANKAKPKKEIYLEVAEIYERIGEYGKATEACQSALDLTPNDMELMTRIKDLAAKQTLHVGRYETAKDFKDSIRDREGTAALLQDENLAKSEEHRKKVLAAAQADWEKNPTDHQLIAKYAKALADMETDEHDTQAIEVLDTGYKATRTYRYRMQAGDIKIRQFKRHFRMLDEALKADPEDETLKQQLTQLKREWLAYEVEEYRDRVANYPSELAFQFEFGKRLFETKNYEEAIGALQQAQNNPRFRVDALHLLGLSFVNQGLLPEATEMLKRAIESYEYAETGDKKSKDIHYALARVQEQTGHDDEAVALYSKITQWDISFRDSRQRLAALRQKKQKAAGA